MTSVLSRTRLLTRFKLNTAVPLVQLYARKMSERADTVLNAADSWFNKYVAVQDAPEGIFKGVSDRFNGITVDSNLETCHPEQFSSVLQKTFSPWQNVHTTLINPYGILTWSASLKLHWFSGCIILLSVSISQHIKERFGHF
ncbi:hypothetical protein RP20_CCG021381 [Aedes albopictus]|nr:hypothetical protein RP20_CCG021381 [Aedes albopictus]